MQAQVSLCGKLSQPLASGSPSAQGKADKPCKRTRRRVGMDRRACKRFPHENAKDHNEELLGRALVGQPARSSGLPYDRSKYVYPDSPSSYMRSSDLVSSKLIPLLRTACSAKRRTRATKSSRA